MPRRWLECERCEHLQTSRESRSFCMGLYKSGVGTIAKVTSIYLEKPLDLGNGTLGKS